MCHGKEMFKQGKGVNGESRSFRKNSPRSRGLRGASEELHSVVTGNARYVTGGIEFSPHPSKADGLNLA